MNRIPKDKTQKTKYKNSLKGDSKEDSKELDDYESINTRLEIGESHGKDFIIIKIISWNHKFIILLLLYESPIHQ